jgi:hypothetical protein
MGRGGFEKVFWGGGWQCLNLKLLMLRVQVAIGMMADVDLIGEGSSMIVIDAY